MTLKEKFLTFKSKLVEFDDDAHVTLRDYCDFYPDDFYCGVNPAKIVDRVVHVDFCLLDEEDISDVRFALEHLGKRWEVELDCFISIEPPEYHAIKEGWKRAVFWI